MLSSLKPNKTNVVGTVLLLVANYAGAFVSRIVSGIITPRNANATQFAGGSGRAAFAGAAGGQYGGMGMLSGAINLVVLAVLFYLVISLVTTMFANTQQSGTSEGEAGKAKRKEKP